MEIEAFAHGALCIAMSGRCGMSLFTSNASANRGACEQNCRKEYVVTDAETGKQLKVDNNFIMSPNDISTIDFLDEVVDAGVNVLKIEGRGRAPEYVYTVITAYRRALQAIEDGEYGKAFVEELHKDLQSVYNRGLSSGYYLGREQGWSAAYGSKATHRKMFIGKISKYLSKLKVIEVRGAATELAVGDTYTIIGHTTGVVKGQVTEIRVDDKTVDRVDGSQTIFSLKVEDKVRVGDQLYLLSPVEEAVHAGN